MRITKHILCLKLLLDILILTSCTSKNNDLFTSPEYVDLAGKKTLTILKNATPDTLYLEGEFFNALPYFENSFNIRIPPSKQDTLKFYFNFPDFIHLYKSSYVQILNAPGRTLYCEIRNMEPGKLDITFKGEMSRQNEYYLERLNSLGEDYVRNRPHIEIADRLKDFNQFPAAVDSITQQSFDFLKNYTKPLPDWFKKHEEWRIRYRAGSLKDNILTSKRFYDGKDIPVSADYYTYEKKLPLVNKEMVFNEDYLWFIRSYVTNKYPKNQIESKNSVLTFSLTDSLLGNTAAGDLFKMDYLASLYYRGRQSEYDSLLSKVHFKDDRKKTILDSLVNLKYGKPTIGEVAPDLELIDGDGRKVELSSFKGNNVIVNFWATWCRPCIAEFSDENRIHLENKDKGLVVVNICIDSPEDQWKVMSDKKGLKMIDLFSKKEEYDYIRKRFGISALPKSILLDRNLRVTKNTFQRASTLTKQDIDQIIK